MFVLFFVSGKLSQFATYTPPTDDHEHGCNESCKTYQDGQHCHATKSVAEQEGEDVTGTEEYDERYQGAHSKDDELDCERYGHAAHGFEAEKLECTAFVIALGHVHKQANEQCDSQQFDYNDRCIKASISEDLGYQSYQYSVCYSSNYYSQLSLEQTLERSGNGSIEAFEYARGVVDTYQPNDKTNERHDAHCDRSGSEKSKQ